MTPKTFRMPEISVYLDIDECAKMAPKPETKLLRSGYYELQASCEVCSKSLADVFVFGLAMMKDGSEWYGSNEDFAKQGGSFDYKDRSLLWLFDNSYYWKRGDTVCACSLQCAKKVEAKLQTSLKPVPVK